MLRRRGVPVHPWVPIAGPALFDQTNGVVNITGDRADPAGSHLDPAFLAERAAASNLVNVGFSGGF